jgi:hypothetical protein
MVTGWDTEAEVFFSLLFAGDIFQASFFINIISEIISGTII